MTSALVLAAAALCCISVGLSVLAGVFFASRK